MKIGMIKRGVSMRHQPKLGNPTWAHATHVKVCRQVYIWKYLLNSAEFGDGKENQNC